MVEVWIGLRENWGLGIRDCIGRFGAFHCGHEFEILASSTPLSPDLNPKLQTYTPIYCIPNTLKAVEPHPRTLNPKSPKL